MGLNFGSDELVVMLNNLKPDKAGSTSQAGIVAEKFASACLNLLAISQDTKIKCDALALLCVSASLWATKLVKMTFSVGRRGIKSRMPGAI